MQIDNSKIRTIVAEMFEARISQLQQKHKYRNTHTRELSPRTFATNIFTLYFAKKLQSNMLNFTINYVVSRKVTLNDSDCSEKATFT